MLALIAAGLLLAAAPSPQPASPSGNPVVVLETEAGRIVIEVDAARAPATARNFLRYVDEGHYDGGEFHRTVRADNQPGKAYKIEVVQAAVEAWEEQSARLQRIRREVALVEEALRGRVFVQRLT